MILPHGSENRRKRIELRAYAIFRDEWGIRLGTDNDHTDINHDEAEEIEEAKRLAEKWRCKDL
jgi:hypothetical protein